MKNSERLAAIIIDMHVCLYSIHDDYSLLSRF